jgi:pSer/pThr/pTyr-binding forkhead associated (FHA) protein
MTERLTDELRASGQSFLVALDSIKGVTFSTSLSIGRNPDNDLVIDHPMVSSWHAAIEWDGERWRIKDLGSSNGTSVNDKRLRARRAINEGDVIRVASVSRWRVEVLVPPRQDVGTGITQRAQDRPGEKDIQLHLTLTHGGDGIIRVIQPGGEWTLETGQRFLLLYILARRCSQWLDDEDLKVQLWGKPGAREVDPSALHKLIYDTRQLFLGHGVDGWFIEKSAGRTRIALSAERVVVSS